MNRSPTTRNDFAELRQPNHQAWNDRQVERQWLDLYEGDELLADIRKSAWSLVPAVIWAAVIAIATGAALGATPRLVTQFPSVIRPFYVTPIRWGIVFAAVVFLFIFVFRKFLAWSRFRAAVTSHRVVIRQKPRGTGWEIPMINIVSVEVLTGFFKRMLGASTVSTRTTFAYEPALMADVPRAQQIASLIMDERAAALAQNAAALAAQGGMPGAAPGPGPNPAAQAQHNGGWA